ncbi:MAG: ATP-binding cassette domain-containing protein [Agathobacter sp.]|nr:ATP-binding cassette domain-containing protein [Agathobacter sp.]
MMRLEHIGYKVDDKVILDDINVEFDDRFIAVTGPNGSGKSTLAKIIMGLIKPTSGKIYFNDEDITELSVNERAKKGISYAFQQPVRFKGLRVRDLLEIANESQNKNDIYEILHEVGLSPEEYLGRELNDTLSGGEMKRIEIAMTVLRRVQLSVFDEPEAGIDLWSFQSLTRLFEKMQKETSGGIVIISHQERILAIADKIIYLKNGKIVDDAESERIIADLQAQK